MLKPVLRSLLISTAGAWLFWASWSMVRYGEIVAGKDSAIVWVASMIVALVGVTPILSAVTSDDAPERPTDRRP